MKRNEHEFIVVGLIGYLLFLTTILFITAQPARAVILINPDKSQHQMDKPFQPFQRWADQAKVPTVPNLVELRFDNIKIMCSSSVAFGCAPEFASVIFIQPHNKHAKSALLHELGHRFDWQMRKLVRIEFGRIINDIRQWTEQPNSLQEQFAEAYRMCAQPKIKDLHFSAYYLPTAGQHEEVCALIRNEGERMNKEW